MIRRAAILTSLIMILYWPATVNAMEAAAFLQEQGPAKVLAFYPYTLFLPRDLIGWAQPVLSEGEIQRTKELLAELSPVDGSLTPQARGVKGNLLLILGAEAKALAELEAAFAGENYQRHVLEPLLYMYAAHGQAVNLARVNRVWLQEQYPLQPLYFALGIGEVVKGNDDGGENFLVQSVRQGQHVPSILYLGLNALSSQNLELAAAYIKEVGQYNPDLLIGNLYSAVICAIKGEMSEAAEVFRQLPAIEQLPLYYYMVYAQALTACSPGEALAVWQNFSETELPRTDIRLNEAFCLYQSGQLRAAQEILKDLASESPVYYALMYLCLRDQEPEKAEPYLAKLLELLGTLPALLKEQAFLKEAQGDYEAALILWRSLKEAFPEDPELPTAEERIRKEQGFFWWSLKGVWLRPRELIMKEGSLLFHDLFDKPILSSQPDFLLAFPEGKAESIWVSCDGLDWSWYSSPYGYANILLTCTGENILHSFVHTNGGEYFRGSAILDTEPPKGGLKPAAGSLYVNTLAIDLELEAWDDVSGVGAFRVRESRGKWSGWQEFTPLFAYRLAQGPDGERRIQVQFQDIAGNISEIYELSIVLDREPPVLVELDFAQVGTHAATLKVKANKDVKVQVQVIPMAGGPLRTVQAFDFSTEHLLEVVNLRPLTSYTVNLNLEDRAANIREVTGYSFQTRRDAEPPKGGILIEGGREYINRRGVTLTLWAAEESGGQIYYSLSSDGRNWDSWQPLTQNEISYTLPADDGLKTVYVRYRDETYNISTVYSAHIWLDGENPELNLDKTIVHWDQIQSIWSSSKEVVGRVRLFNDDGEAVRIIDEWGETHSCTFWDLQPDTQYFLEIIITDRAENINTIGPIAVRTKKQPVNIAASELGTEATASSVYLLQEGRYTSNRAIDGDINTYWQAAFLPQPGTPQWLEIQLAETKEFNAMRILVPAVASIQEFKLEYHTGSTWEPFLHYRENQAIPAGNVEVIKHEYISFHISHKPVQAKRIRLVIISGGTLHRIFLPQVLIWEVYNIQ